MAKTQKNKDLITEHLTPEQNKEALDNLKQLQDGKRDCITGCIKREKMTDYF